MKKLVIGIILLFCMVFGGNMVYAANNKPISKAVKTDITAYINGVPIPSYNINGSTGIIVEDLENYGFDVKYEPEKRVLNIFYSNTNILANNMPFTTEQNTKNKEITEQKIPSTLYGSAFDIYQTDIITLLHDKTVPAYNIGGKTILLMDTLKEYGNVIWYPDERKICFEAVSNWEMHFSDEKNELYENADIHRFLIEVNKNEKGGFDISGENIPYLSDPIMFVSYATKTFCLQFDFDMDDPACMKNINMVFSKMMTIKADGTIVKEYADIANQCFEIYINGKKKEISSVVEFYGNNHEGYEIYLNDFVPLEDFKTMKIACKW